MNRPENPGFLNGSTPLGCVVVILLSGLVLGTIVVLCPYFFVLGDKANGMIVLRSFHQVDPPVVRVMKHINVHCRIFFISQLNHS